MSEDEARPTEVTASVAAPADLAPEPGTLLGGRYQVIGTLGIGGAGVVVQATDLQANESVAIKLLRGDANADENTVERFLREARAAFRLRSEHAARVRDVGTFDDGRPFMAMELLEGMDLGRLLAANLRVDRAFAVDLVLQAADALAEAHGIGIVHRDIKPSNLFVTWRPDGTSSTKVLDFGISKSPVGSGKSITNRSSLLGTPAYMSPEQMRSASNVDARTDVWSLGTVLYEMVEGRQPFHGSSYAEMCVLVTTTEPAAMTLAPELSPIVMRCLAKRPEDRFATIAELAFALAPFASDPTHARTQLGRMYRLSGKAAPYPTASVNILAQPPAPVAPPTPPAGSRRALVVIATVVVILGVATGLAAALGVFSS